MTTDLQNSATTRALPLRMRGDLVVRQLQYGGETCWGVKDPVTLSYFQLQEEEYFILQMLDGETSLEEIRDRFQQRFAPLRLEMRQLHGFLGKLHSDGLILSSAAEQGEQMLKRGRKRRRQEIWQTLSNVLAIRFRGIDPERILHWLSPKVGWMFSRWAVAGAMILAAAALTLVAVQWTALQTRLPEFGVFFGPHNLFWIAISLGGVKVLHELGHGLTCKRFGGECHELGVMFLVFTPCLYCNVSDAWMLRSKWKRAAIGAAGIYVEVILASVCTFLWFFSEPGLLNTICLNVMFVCSVGTVLFNGNPLLRYDGYYVLSDIIEVPNMGQQSNNLLKHWLARWFLGIELFNRRALPQQKHGFLAVYSVAAIVYRLFLVTAILWFVYQLLKPYGLQVAAQVLALTVVSGMFILPIGRGLKFLTDPMRNRDVKRVRFLILATATAAVLAGVFLIPLPCRVSAPAVVEPHGARRVYVTLPGTRTYATTPGKKVKAGELLVKLENQELKQEIIKLESECEEKQKHLDNLEKQRTTNADADNEIPAATKALKDARQRLTERKTVRLQLELKSPIAGTVLPPRRRNDPPPPGELPTWTGSPLDKENENALLESGTLICWVGNPRQLEAVSIVDQADIAMVRIGQRVALQFDSLPGEVLWGKVIEKSEIDLEVVPPELIALKKLPTVTEEDGSSRPASASYQVRVSIEPHNRHCYYRQPVELKSASPQDRWAAVWSDIYDRRSVLNFKNKRFGKDRRNRSKQRRTNSSN